MTKKEWLKVIEESLNMNKEVVVRFADKGPTASKWAKMGANQMFDAQMKVILAALKSDLPDSVCSDELGTIYRWLTTEVKNGR